MDRAEARGSSDDQGVTHSEWQAVCDRQVEDKEAQLLRQKENDEQTAAEAEQERLNKDRFFGLDDSVAASANFRGTQLKVIVKVGMPYLILQLHTKCLTSEIF